MTTDPIRTQLDTWDAEHDTTGCPVRFGCIHTAVAALREVLDLCDDMANDPRSADYAPGPAGGIRIAIAEAIGVDDGLEDWARKAVAAWDGGPR